MIKIRKGENPGRTAGSPGGYEMKITARKFLILLFAVVFVSVTFVSVGMSATDSVNDNPGIKTVTFGVTCYDVGKAALDGLAGIKKVTRGWKDFMEVNTVWYDPSVIGIKEMEDALRKADTYQKTFGGK